MSRRTEGPNPLGPLSVFPSTVLPSNQGTHPRIDRPAKQNMTRQQHEPLSRRNLTLILYYISALVGRDGVENGVMVNFLRSMEGLPPLEGDALTDETCKFDRAIQQHLPIEPVPGRRSGGPGRDRGWRRTTDAGSNEARRMLAQILATATEG